MADGKRVQYKLSGEAINYLETIPSHDRGEYISRLIQQDAAKAQAEPQQEPEPVSQTGLTLEPGVGILERMERLLQKLEQQWQ